MGFIAGRLNMRVLGRRTADGKIDFYFKTRGETRVLAKILEQMDEDGYDGVHPVLISECGNQTAAQLLHHGIDAKWPGAPVRIVPCSGLCSFMRRIRDYYNVLSLLRYKTNRPGRSAIASFRAVWLLLGRSCQRLDH